MPDTDTEQPMTKVSAYERLHEVRSILAVVAAAISGHSVWHGATSTGIETLLERAIDDLDVVGDALLPSARSSPPAQSEGE